jgi:alkanesulfonate monooxygenase SsuD/methylene tetrahydromethanopterin reductase-like flavin-dependent oxidoreductase (luciferase family)
MCQGWLPAKVTPAQIAQGRAKIAEYAAAAGRDPDDLTTALQSVVCLGATDAKARETFLKSSFDLFRTSLKSTMTKGVDLDAYLDTNLVGSPDTVCEKIDQFGRAGVEHFTALLFVANTVDEMRDQMRLFAREVMPSFSCSASSAPRVPR